MKLNSYSKMFLSLGGLLMLAGCVVPVAKKSSSVEAVLATYTDNTVVATYSKMSDAAIALDKAVADLKAQPTDAKIAEAAKLWSRVRGAWEQSESFLFGPASFTNLDPKLDSWPLDQAQLDTILAAIDGGKLEVDASYVRDYLGAALRGFHAVEYLLFRDGKPRLAKDLTSGQLAYLAAAVRVLAEDSITLEAWWVGMDELSEEKSAILEAAEIEVGGSYANELKNAGKAGSRYESQDEAIEEIIQGCIDIASELAEAKIGGPAKSGDPKEFESWYSFTSLDDCRNNLISVRNAYEGVEANGNNISSLVAAKSKDADAKVKASIASAFKSLDAFKAPFCVSLESNKADFATAVAACEELSKSLEEALELFTK